MFGAKSSPIKKKKRRQAAKNLGLTAFFLYPQVDWYGAKFGPKIAKRARQAGAGLRGMRRGGAARGAAAEAAEVAEVAVI